MNISFENADKIRGLLTLTVEEADYKDKVEKTLKDYRKKANLPGFRPGQAPMGLIKRQIGTSVKADEINRLVGEQLYNYIKENNIAVLGEPLPSEKQQPQDLEQPAPYTFVFDMAIAPEFKVELTEKDKLNYYEITVDDKMVDEQVNVFTSRAGEYEKSENYQEGDLIKGDLRELNEDGSTKEGGITVEDAIIMPQYIKVDDQKKLFDGAKLGDIITFNPKKAYPESNTEVTSLLKISKEEAEGLTADFSYQIKEISRFNKAKIDQALFDTIYGKGEVTSEEDFRKRIAEGMSKDLAQNSDYKFLVDLRAYCEKKVGKLPFAEDLLKRVMQTKNKDKGADFVEKNFENSMKELQWHLIKEQLVATKGIKVEDADVRKAAKEQARMLFAQYGMNNVTEEVLDNYVTEMMKQEERIHEWVDQAVDHKLTEALKNVVKLTKKKVSFEEFKKLMEEK